jgi:hypothetical protein
MNKKKHENADLDIQVVDIRDNHFGGCRGFRGVQSRGIDSGESVMRCLAEKT